MRTLATLLAGAAIGGGLFAASASPRSVTTYRLRLGDHAQIGYTGWYCSMVSNKLNSSEMACDSSPRPGSLYIVLTPRAISVDRCLTGSCSRLKRLLNAHE
jgi:hypothetical protein